MNFKQTMHELGQLWKLSKVFKAMVAAVFLVLLALSVSSPCSADADFRVQVGPAIVKDQFAGSFTSVAQLRFVDRYSLSVGHIGELEFDTCGRPDCEWKTGRQLMVGAEYHVPLGSRLSFSFGPYYFQNKSRVSTANLNVRVALEWQITYRLSVLLSHFSNAGSGEETLLVNEHNAADGWFCRDDDGVEVCGPTRFRQAIIDDANVGYDSVMASWRF